MIITKVKNQNIPHHVNMWYDRHNKSWVAQLMDVYENQVGEAIYSHSKQEAISNKEQLQKQI